MIQQLVEVPAFSLKEGDIIYNQMHDLLQIVIDVNIPKNGFENESSTMSFRAISEETEKYKARERIPFGAKVNKLITITNEDISTLLKAKEIIMERERKKTLGGEGISAFEVVYEEK